jgi:RNA polymerase primary sigma factor
MATKTKEAAGATETREESTDGPLMDSVVAAVKKLLQKAKERGYVSYDEINQVLPPDQVSSEQIEDTMAIFSEMGITVVENEEQEDSNTEGEETNVRATGNLDDEDIGRTDDPVRMYLREMGSVELLSREGEIAIAKRIEAGREKMISGICENPLTILALLSWRAALVEGQILLRDIIDLDRPGRDLWRRPERRGHRQGGTGRRGRRGGRGRRGRRRGHGRREGGRREQRGRRERGRREARRRRRGRGSQARRGG